MPMTKIFKKEALKDMDKTVVAVIFGGYSPEYTVSLNSAYSVINAIDREKYEVIMVGITNAGKWFLYDGPVEDIPTDKWSTMNHQLKKAFVSPDRGGGLSVVEDNQIKPVHIDVAFPVMHGRYGEDGTVQGLFELANIPVVGSGSAASALCMDKDRSHRLASFAGITVPKSVCVNALLTDKEILEAVQSLELPVFVKPVKAGSSLGTTKHFEYANIPAAVKEALKYDDVVLIEENIDGKEVGCGVVGNNELQTGRVNEIEVEHGSYFTYEEKYTLKTAKIITPARIDAESERKIKEVAKTIYRILGCRGYARIDMFLTDDGDVVFSEANTIPGFTEFSQLPAMMKAAGVEYPKLVERLIELGLQVERGEWYG